MTTKTTTAQPVPLRMTITVDYPGNPDNYDTDDPILMAVVDSEQLPDHPAVILHLMEKHGFIMEVEPR